METLEMKNLEIRELKEEVHRLRKVGNEMFGVLCSHAIGKTDFNRIARYKRWRQALGEGK